MEVKLINTSTLKKINIGKYLKIYIGWNKFTDEGLEIIKKMKKGNAAISIMYK